MRKVWGRKNSSNVMKVLWLLEELSLPYDRIDVGGPFGRTKDADYVAMNPNSIIPTLEEENGFTLWESNVILRYLASCHADGSPLWPKDLQARANIDRWMDWQQTILGPPATVVFQGLVRTPPDQRLCLARRPTGPSCLRRRAGLHARGHPRRRACASLVLVRHDAPGATASARLVRRAAATPGLSRPLCGPNDVNPARLLVGWRGG
jgi:glutathione S-transferase